MAWADIEPSRWDFCTSGRRWFRNSSALTCPRFTFVQLQTKIARMFTNGQLRTALNRRTFLGGAGLGLGSAALSSLLAADLPRTTAAGARGAADDSPVLSHITPRAKRVIFLYM